MIEYIPGTVIKFDEEAQKSAYNVIKPFFAFTSGITLAQVRELTGLEKSTIQNWVKRGWVASPINKGYGERQIFRIILINSIRRSMQIERVITLMAYINGSVEDASDDIISDGRLFDEFCHAVSLCDRAGTYDGEQIKKIVDEQISQIPDIDDAGKNKLKKALQIMVLAFIAAQIQDKTDEEFNNLFA